MKGCFSSVNGSGLYLGVKLLFGETKGFYWSFNGGARWIWRPKMEGEGLSHHSARNKLDLLLLLLLHGKQFHLEPLKRPPLHPCPRDLDLKRSVKDKNRSCISVFVFVREFVSCHSLRIISAFTPPRSNASLSD